MKNIRKKRKTDGKPCVPICFLLFFATGSPLEDKRQTGGTLCCKQLAIEIANRWSLGGKKWQSLCFHRSTDVLPCDRHLFATILSPCVTTHYFATCSPPVSPWRQTRGNCHQFATPLVHDCLLPASFPLRAFSSYLEPL